MLIDTREPKTLLNKIDAALHGDTQPLCLDSADYVIFDRDGCSLGIERKTVGDLLGSLRSGRLNAQLGRMAECYNIVVLLIEGLLNMAPDGRVTTARMKTGWSHASIQAYLWSIQAKGVRLLTTAGQAETVDLLRVLDQRGRAKCLATNAPAIKIRRKAS
jgi:ERCC4-type nuclease